MCVCFFLCFILTDVIDKSSSKSDESFQGARKKKRVLFVSYHACPGRNIAAFHKTRMVFGVAGDIEYIELFRWLMFYLLGTAEGKND